MGREEHPVWGESDEFEAWKASTVSSCRYFRDSASDNLSVSLHRVQEAFGILLFCLFLKRGWYWHSGKVLDSTAAECHLRAVRLRLENVAAEITIHCEVSLQESPVWLGLLTARQTLSPQTCPDFSAVWTWFVEEWTAHNPSNVGFDVP